MSCRFKSQQCEKCGIAGHSARIHHTESEKMRNFVLTNLVNPQTGKRFERFSLWKKPPEVVDLEEEADVDMYAPPNGGGTTDDTQTVECCDLDDDVVIPEINRDFDDDICDITAICDSRSGARNLQVICPPAISIAICLFNQKDSIKLICYCILSIMWHLCHCLCYLCV